MLVLALYIVTVAAVKGCLVQWKLESLEGLGGGGGLSDILHLELYSPGSLTF